MHWFRSLRIVYKILLPVSITLVLVFGLLTWKIQTEGSSIVSAVAERELAALARQAGNRVLNMISEPLNSAIEIAGLIGELESENIPATRPQIVDMLKYAQLHDEILSTNALFTPLPSDAKYKNTIGSDANGQFHPYVAGSDVTLLDMSSYNELYFTVPHSTRKPYISKPFEWTNPLGQTTLMFSLGAPVVVNGESQGVIVFDFSLERMTKQVQAISLYSTGVVSLVMEDGTFLAHPDPDLVLKNMFELGRWRGNQELRSAFANKKPYREIVWDGTTENIYYMTPFTFPQTGQTMYAAVIVPLEEVLAAVGQLTSVTGFASIMALVVLLTVIFIGVRTSVKPLGVINNVAREVSNGNYAIKIDSEKFGGEIKELGESLSNMLTSLVQNISKAEALSKDAQEQTAKAQVAMKEADVARVAAEGAKREGMLAAAGQLEHVVNIITTASQQLSVQIEESEQGFTVQAERMGETATAMEEMNSTVLEVASNASAASDISIQTRAKAEAGTHIVQSAVTGIQRVQTVSLALKDDMNILAKQADSITTIMNVISDIADQTNLLALNAAIEAARAGDAGRGFAVVADEVRKLAEKTMVSTTDVGNAIKSIQSSVNTSIRQVDQTVELIASATEQATESGYALAEIVSLVDSTAGQVQAIATASEEQSATSEEINRSITEINSIAVNSAQTMRESALAVNDLASQTHALGSLIEEMKKG